MINLLLETLEALRLHQRRPGDVRWVGSRNGHYAIQWSAFAAIADIEYDPTAQQIACDLVVVGGDWWLERYSYWGGEHWVFRSTPEKDFGAAPFARVKAFKFYGPETIDQIAQRESP